MTNKKKVDVRPHERSWVVSSEMRRHQQEFLAAFARTIRWNAKMRAVIVRRSNGLWHVYGLNGDLLSPEEGVDEWEIIAVLKRLPFVLSPCQKQASEQSLVEVKA